MSRAGNLEGKVVSEEEVATDLGFVNVTELRRWQTDLGTKVMELEHQLSQVQGDADRFKWHGRRMVVVFEKLDEALWGLQQGIPIPADTLAKLRLAMAVVCGQGVDWDHVLKDWLPMS